MSFPPAEAPEGAWSTAAPDMIYRLVAGRVGVDKESDEGREMPDAIFDNEAIAVGRDRWSVTTL